MQTGTSAHTRRTTWCRWGWGGAPYDPRNLWPEPRATADGWNADVKDELEAGKDEPLDGL